MSYQELTSKKESLTATITISLMLFLAALFIAYYVHQSQQAVLSQILKSQADSTQDKLLKNTQDLMADLNGMAKRWQNNQGTSEANWRADAQDFINRAKGVDTIWWIDEGFRNRWVESLQYDHYRQINELLTTQKMVDLLVRSKEAGAPEFTPAFDLGEYKVIYIIQPIGSGSSFDGFLAIEVHIGEFIDDVLGDPLKSGFYTKTYSSTDTVYSNGPELGASSHLEYFMMNLDSDEEGWVFKVYPTEASLDLIISPLPYFIAIAGTIIAALFMLTLMSKLKANNQSFELSRQISEREKAQFELEYLANHDTLTHLPNRHYITNFIKNKVKQGAINEQQFTLLFIDLDHFKDINDTLGHAVGDEMLKKLPVLFNRVFRHDDVIARMGGDEFVVYLPGKLSVDHVTKLVERFLKSLEYPIRIDEHQIRLTGSVGVAFFPQHGENVIELLSHADAALYRAKAMGRNTYAIYDSTLEQKAKDRVQLISRLHTANDNDEFDMFFQPRYRLSDGKLIGAEALLRWQPSPFELVEPVEFIDFLEETSLIIPVTWQMFERSCIQFKPLLERNSELFMSFNISAKQLEHPEFITKLQQLLTLTEFPAERLELELTEQTLIQNVENSRHILRQLTALGISVAIDDFGTGYSSLSYLKNFPVNVLKIDKSFIHDIDTDKDDFELVKTMITMGRNLRITTVAEGIENEEQLNLLKQESCDQAQGFYYNKPMPFIDFKKLV
ncbi:putative bifunctional diguanylate cyclase/phosphodiesterase [Marinicella sediminis]|uniref:Bifunctional diguanylate cyclase/phosphodiesterase n=1 Tax=Marinicella sediminis TaxID=1792834 RepID=A0ABV7J735_9GAMM|nr:bifunctional diguanylate cyclase/phosphodiesterase [Marinicella sediminis]